MTTVNKNSLIKKFADKFNFPDEEKLINTLKATAFKVKEGTVSDEQMSALLIVADQYGLNPFTKEIFAFPDKQNGIVPVVSVDGWSRIINQHPDMDGLEFVYDQEIVTLNGSKPCPTSIECVIYRKDRTHPVRIREFLDETYREPFSGNGSNGKPYVISGPWQSHTKRMLRHKSLIQCSRIAFGFVGIFDQDEAERIIEGQAVIITDPSSSLLEPSLEAKRMSEKLILRAQKAGAWQAALDYAGENFSDFNLVFLTDEINKAKALSEAAPLPNDVSNDGNGSVNQAGAATHQDDPKPENTKKPPVNNKAKEALNNAKQNLS
jgi:phage recombination protein Bet